MIPVELLMVILALLGLLERVYVIGAVPFTVGVTELPAVPCAKVSVLVE